MTETRSSIADAVRDRPGVHFNELVRSLDLAPGQVQYHLRRLREDDSVVVERLYGQTHYYPPAYDDWERGALALLRRETAGDVVAYLLAHGPDRPGTVADELHIARSTLEWPLDRLVEHDLVESALLRWMASSIRIVAWVTGTVSRSSRRNSIVRSVVRV